MRYGMVIDLKRCMGCQSCTIACKAEHGTPPSIFYTRVLEEEIGTYPDARTRFVPVQCNHCGDAPCVQVCPSGATQQGEDGIVTVDGNVCIGCRACYVACPYKNRFYYDRKKNEGYYGNVLTPFEQVKYAEFTSGTVVKCNFCKQRITRGEDPACVATCPAKARTFGDLEDQQSEVSNLIRERDGFQILADLGTDPSIYYLEE